MYAMSDYYKHVFNNCDTHTDAIVRAAGKEYDYCRVSPNASFNNTSLYYTNRRLWQLTKVPQIPY